MITNAYIQELVERIAQGKRIRRKLPDGGLLHMDRPLPFLCVYRFAPGNLDAGLKRIVQAEASYILMPSGTAWKRWGSKLLQALTTELAKRFNGLLLLELWHSYEKDQVLRTHPRSGEPLPPKPWFRVTVPSRFAHDEAVECLLEALEKVTVARQHAQVQCFIEPATQPAGMTPLLGKTQASNERIYTLGLDVSAIYRTADDDVVFPSIIRIMRRGISRALNQCFYVFARTKTTMRPYHYHTLGRRTVGKSVWEADRILAEVENRFDPLLLATPINTESAWLAFKRCRFDKTPVFHYRPTQVDTMVLKRRLFSAPVERIEDPTLAYLFRQKQDELDRQITSLNDIGTPKFLAGSMQIHGRVMPDLLELAKTLLERIPPRRHRKKEAEWFNSEAIAQRAREEITRYGAIDPSFCPEVLVREDLFTGMMVSRGRLLIGKDMKVTRKRMEALVQHEVGTHLLTYHNGKNQSLHQLALGLAGYDGFQEGLAVLAEYFVDGLSQGRLRLLAARVVAVNAMLEGASFIEVFRLINRYYSFPQQAAYLVTMRVFRGGGLTKDAIYLRGLMQILAYLQEGGSMKWLWIGKIATDHIPFIEELQLRKVIQPPALTPFYTHEPAWKAKLERLRLGLTVFDLLTPSSGK